MPSSEQIATQITRTGLHVSPEQVLLLSDDGYAVVELDSRTSALHIARHVTDAFAADPESGLPTIVTAHGSYRGHVGYFVTVRAARGRK